MDTPFGFTLALFLVIGLLAALAGVLRLSQALRDRRLPRALAAALRGPASASGLPRPSLRMA